MLWLPQLGAYGVGAGGEALKIHVFSLRAAPRDCLQIDCGLRNLQRKVDFYAPGPGKAAGFDRRTGTGTAADAAPGSNRPGGEAGEPIGKAVFSKREGFDLFPRKLASGPRASMTL